MSQGSRFALVFAPFGDGDACQCAALGIAVPPNR